MRAVGSAASAARLLLAEPELCAGLINDCGRICGQGKSEVKWFDMSTLKEPYRIEGKKTMGLELAEQFNYTKLPDVIFYPTGASRPPSALPPRRLNNSQSTELALRVWSGGGTGLIGMWKAFNELQEMGWIPASTKLPKMVCVQASGCAPIVKAWSEGKEHAPLWKDAATAASGIRVPIAVGDFLIIRAVRESEGWCTMVDDDRILKTAEECAKQEGLLLCPEGAATLAAYEMALESGQISPNETAVLFNCATGLKCAARPGPALPSPVWPA